MAWKDIALLKTISTSILSNQSYKHIFRKTNYVVIIPVIITDKCNDNRKKDKREKTTSKESITVIKISV